MVFHLHLCSSYLGLTSLFIRSSGLGEDILKWTSSPIPVVELEKWMAKSLLEDDLAIGTKSPMAPSNSILGSLKFITKHQPECKHLALLLIPFPCPVASSSKFTQILSIFPLHYLSPRHHLPSSLDYYSVFQTGFSHHSCYPCPQSIHYIEAQAMVFLG